MGSHEKNFALKVEELLSSITFPEYRQMIVEVIHNKLTLGADFLHNYHWIMIELVFHLDCITTDWVLLYVHSYW